MSTMGDEALLNKPGLPVPKATVISQPHWDGCKKGQLLVQHCDECNAYTFPPEIVCPQCLKSSLLWKQSSGKGVIYSFTVVHRPQRPEFAAPYVAAIIELEEGWHMMSNIIDCDIDSIEIGQAVEVSYVKREDFSLPMFKLLTVP